MKNKEIQVTRFSLIKNELQKIVDSDEKNTADRIKATNLIHSLVNFKLTYYFVLLVTTILFVVLYISLMDFFIGGGNISLSIYNNSNELKFIFFGKTNIISLILSVVVFACVLLLYFVGLFYFKEKFINSFFNKIKPDQLIHTNFNKIKEKSKTNLYDGIGILILDVFIGLFD